MNGHAQWLDELNADTGTPELVATLHACCAARSWIAAVLGARPYGDNASLFVVSDGATLALDDTGLAQALAAHPRIGERAATSGGSEAAESTWSRQEQSGMSEADSALRDQIADANRRYEQRFGHVYLVCATGLSATQLLSICLDRLDNDPPTERSVVLAELAKIARLRLTRLLHPQASPSTTTGWSR